jgi:hypothetical protein
MRKIDSYFDEIPLTLQVANLTEKRKKNAAEKGQKRVEIPSIIEEVLTSKRVESSSYNLDGVKINMGILALSVKKE